MLWWRMGSSIVVVIPPGPSSSPFPPLLILQLLLATFIGTTSLRSYTTFFLFRTTLLLLYTVLSLSCKAFFLSDATFLLFELLRMIYFVMVIEVLTAGERVQADTTARSIIFTLQIWKDRTMCVDLFRRFLFRNQGEPSTLFPSIGKSDNHGRWSRSRLVGRGFRRASGFGHRFGK